MTRNQARYYDWIARRRCLACGASGCEVAHIRAFRSPKTDDLLPRRHGIAEYAVLPLCVACHRAGMMSIHALGEAGFEAALGRGDGYLAQKAGSLLAEWIVTNPL